MKWAGLFETRSKLTTAIGAQLLPALQDSIRETADGWRLAFDPDEIVTSQAHLNGDHWPDWLASTCPALVIRGDRSPLTKAEHLHAMASRRANTDSVELDGGHAVHVDNPKAFASVLIEFLTKVAAS